MHISPLFKGPAIGLGTWQMGERGGDARTEIQAIVHALEQGVRLIDTAEMYADGVAESITGQALKIFGNHRRHEITLVTKVLPHHASESGTVRACEESLRRLGQSYVDMYLLHWQGSHPYEQTLDGLAALRERGLIRRWGVSNFDTADLSEWLSVEAAMGLQDGCATNQVFYSLMARGPEFDLLPAMEKIGMPLMAYTPLGSGELARHAGLKRIAQKLGISAAQLALAWTIRSGNVVAIPKSSTPSRIDENLAAASLALPDTVLAEIDTLFPPPQRKRPLVMV